MSKRMSERELQQRKRLQAGISQTTGALGLAGLGLLGASKAPKGARTRILRAIPKAQGKISADKLKGASAGAVAASAGIGGAGSFNFAEIQSAEARKRRSDQERARKIAQASVKKNDGVSAFGVTHTTGDLR